MRRKASSALAGRRILLLAAAISAAVFAASAAAADHYAKREFLHDVEVMRAGDATPGRGQAYEAVKRILAHGDKALPWMIERLDDTRKMGWLAIPNSAPNAAEEFSQAPGHTVNVGLRELLGTLTGFSDMLGVSRGDQLRAARKWRKWYARHKHDLHWVPDRQYFRWKRDPKRDGPPPK